MPERREIKSARLMLDDGVLQHITVTVLGSEGFLIIFYENLCAFRSIVLPALPSDGYIFVRILLPEPGILIGLCALITRGTPASYGMQSTRSPCLRALATGKI